MATVPLSPLKIEVSSLLQGDQNRAEVWGEPTAIPPKAGVSVVDSTVECTRTSTLERDSSRVSPHFRFAVNL